VPAAGCECSVVTEDVAAPSGRCPCSIPQRRPSDSASFRCHSSSTRSSRPYACSHPCKRMLIVFSCGPCMVWWRSQRAPSQPPVINHGLPPNITPQQHSPYMKRRCSAVSPLWRCLSFEVVCACAWRVLTGFAAQFLTISHACHPCSAARPRLSCSRKGWRSANTLDDARGVACRR
jgi:hypothetical protein